jgi:hypothetical protein
MSDDLKQRKDADRGVRAQALLDNELLKEAFEKIESFTLDAFKNSKADEAQLRDDAWRSYKLLQNLKGELSRLVITGKDASKQLLQVKKPFLQGVI